MIWDKKCCCCLPLDIGCVALGIISFIICTFTSACSLAYLITCSYEQAGVTSSSELQLHNMIIEVHQLHALLWILVPAGSFGMIFSLLVVVGIRKNKSGFVLCFFAYGTLVTFLTFMIGLLFLLKMYWIVAFAMFLLDTIFVYFLILIHGVYELMQRGLSFGSSAHLPLDEENVDDDLQI